MSASPESLIMDYISVLRTKLTKPLIEKEADGVRLASISYKGVSDRERKTIYVTVTGFL